MRYQLAPQRYESSSGSKHVVHKQDTLPPEPFGMELQIGGAVSVPVRALELRPVISDGYRPVPVGYSHVRRELAAERLVPGAVLLPCGCRDGNQHGTVPVLLNRPDAAGGDGEELDEKVGLLAALETPDGVRHLLPLEGNLVVPPDGAIVIKVQTQAAVQAEETLKAVVERKERLAEVIEESEDKDIVPETCLVLAAGIEPVHEARQVPALVQAHADGQAAVEVGLADDVPAAPGEMLLVAGTGLQKEIELAVVLETDDILAAQAACDLAQDAALLLDDRRSGKEGVLSDKDSLVHSDDVWSVTNMRNVRHTASGKGGKYAEGRADM